MIKHTNKTDKKGRKIYVNVLTGNESILETQVFVPSQRRVKRQSLAIRRVTSNRKVTKGRRIYYQMVMQTILNKKNKIVKKISTGRVIKHFSETKSALERKLAFLKFTKQIV